MTQVQNILQKPLFDVLIADSKELTRETIRKILQQKGYTVDTAKDGKECTEQLTKNNFSYGLVITEIIMSHVGGFEIIEFVKKHSTLPVIVLSAIADEDTISESFRLNADDFIKKPFMMGELVQRIERLMIRRRAQLPRPAESTVTMPETSARAVTTEKVVTVSKEEKRKKPVAKKKPATETPVKKARTTKPKPKETSKIITLKPIEPPEKKKSAPKKAANKNITAKLAAPKTRSKPPVKRKTK